VAGHARGNSATVDWVCRRPEHRAAPSRGGRGGLTVYRAQWAYCDGMTDDAQHDWAPTGGVGIDRLIDWTKALDPWRSRTIRP
jgi:hypothetical protein